MILKILEMKKMKFDYKIFLFIMFLWAMLIIMTGWMTQPMFHAINGVGFLFIIFYLYLTMKNMKQKKIRLGKEREIQF